MRPFRRPFLAFSAALLLAGSLAAPAAEACAPCIPQRYRPQPAASPIPVGLIDSAGAKVLLARDGDQVAMHLQVQYYGDAKAFGMVVPVPAEPTVGVGSEELFSALRDATRPDFALTRRTEGTCRAPKQESSGGWGAGAPASKAAPNAGAAAPRPAVEVVSRSEVGPYDATVLRAEDASSLRTWLEQNEYDVPAKLDAAMAGYIAEKAYFVAVKLQKDREAGDIQPLVLKYKSDQTGAPMRLASVAAVPDMDIYMWVLGDKRAVPDNYEHVEINEARLDWLDDGQNYRQVVTEAMNEAGGRAWVTDFAGKSSAVKLPAELKRRAELDTISLAAKTNAADFVAHVREQRYFLEAKDELAFFKRAFPKPADAAGTPDEAFYRDSAALGVLVLDPQKAMQELQTTYIQPAKDAQRLFAEHPYLTQMYTTLSPAEMTSDPTFVFTKEMGDVSNHHKAEAITVCSDQYYASEAPIKIKLPNGHTWLAQVGTPTGRTSPTGSTVKVPAARRVMKCGTGAPRTITDNFAAIGKTLTDLFNQRIVLRVRTNAGDTPRDGAGTSFLVSFGLESYTPAAGSGGFGCLGCAQSNTPPVVQGQPGEGLAYALVFLGFLGYRRSLRK